MYRDHSTWAKPGNFDYTTTGYILPNMSAALEENHIFSPATVNSARLGWTNQSPQTLELLHSMRRRRTRRWEFTTQAGSSILQALRDKVAAAPGLRESPELEASALQGGFSDWVQNYQFFDDVSTPSENTR